MDREPLLRYWTLHSPEGHIATCELVRTATGFEMRCGWSSGGAQTRVARTTSIEAVTDALGVAETWKAAYVDQGWAVRPPNSRPN